LGSNGVKACKRGCAPCRRNQHEFSIYRAGGTGIEPAPCGFGARGAPSIVVQGRPTALGIHDSWHSIIQRRPSTSRRSVVSFVVSATSSEHRERVVHELECSASPGHLKATSHSNFDCMPYRRIGERLEGGVQHRAAPQCVALAHTSRLRPVARNLRVSHIITGHRVG
jgi:hypothetical protein